MIMERGSYALQYPIPDVNRNKIIKDLSQFTERFINEDGTVAFITRNDSRFLKSVFWNVEMFKDIEQFKENACREFGCKNRPLYFEFSNETVNMEMRFIVYHKVFCDEWSVVNLFAGQIKNLYLVAQFIKEKYPGLVSLLDLDINVSSDEWIDWLEQHGTSTMEIKKNKERNMAKHGWSGSQKTSLALYLPNLCKWLRKYLDDREEWEKDGWDVRNLEKYGVPHNKTVLSYYIHYSMINPPAIRNQLKEYIKQKLLNKTFAWSTARMYVDFLRIFFRFIYDLEPSWQDLRQLERKHILAYIAHLNQYCATQLNYRRANPEQYKNRGLTILHKFLSDLQLYENEIAPVRDARTLIFPEDKPKIPKKFTTDYVPDFVLEQLFRHINNLPPDIVPVVWIMFKTGFRISDALLLRQDCLLRLNGQYWVETDIQKTYTKAHRVPIDDELAAVIAGLIDLSKKNSNDYNNPEKFIFARLSGSRRGKPLAQYLVREHLNDLAYTKNITDEAGNRYHFTNHAFRHTYAVKLINGGADIITIQELLAHASPEMTMRYARLMDDTKRKTFDRLVAQGIFSFEGEKLIEIDGEDIPADIIDMLWTSHKLDAIDTPYGTCLQRTKGKCGFAKSPPCLTCNAGTPCLDLCVGAFEGDVDKYEILISSATALITQAKRYGRVEMVKENTGLLSLYREVHGKICAGNLIYGRMERLINNESKL